jgi:hypothetical protein
MNVLRPVRIGEHTMSFYDDFDDDLDELRRERQARRRYSAQLSRHPDPRDPDHPVIEEQEEAVSHV